MSPVHHEFDAVRALSAGLPAPDHRHDKTHDAFDQIERALFNLRLASERAGIPFSSDIEHWADRVAHRLTLPTTTPHEEK